MAPLCRRLSGELGPGLVRGVGVREAPLSSAPPVESRWISLAFSSFSRGAVVESSPVWLRVGPLEETSETQGCVSSVRTIPGDSSEQSRVLLSLT